jgi:hypothetical protein
MHTELEIACQHSSLNQHKEVQTIIYHQLFTRMARIRLDNGESVTEKCESFVSFCLLSRKVLGEAGIQKTHCLRGKVRRRSGREAGVGPLSFDFGCVAKPDSLRRGDYAIFFPVDNVVLKHTFLFQLSMSRIVKVVHRSITKYNMSMRIVCSITGPAKPG